MTKLTHTHRAGYHRTSGPGTGRESLVVHQRHSRVDRRAGPAEGSPQIIRGYGAVFYQDANKETEYWLWDDMVERIRPGAFDRALSESQDVRGLFNHDVDHVLGRTASGTMRLSIDTIGLAYEIDGDAESRLHNDVGRMIDRGDVSGSSFAFRARSVTWQEQDNIYIRWIEDVDLYDVGPVTFPAYEGATSGRSSDYESLIEERQSFIAERLAAESEPFDVELAARLARLN